MADDDSLKSDVDRNRDYMYRILTSRSSTELDKVLAAVVALIQERTSHPVSMSVLASIDFMQGKCTHDYMYMNVRYA